ncbi:MAG: N-acetylmuramoyl-L-alanine amidase [Micrococcaceae bacterium]|nr:N-acetylmuramoyl-L-alanine amidase [Micrococcaceae bacterium]
MSYKLENKPADTRNYNDRPGGRKPKGILLHHWGTDGQSHDNVVAYLRRYRPANPTSAHEVISAGRVSKLVPLLKRAWHARSANNDWIGLENRPEMSDGDWATLVERCADIERETGRSMRYGKHNDVVNTACPGRYASRIGELVNAVNANLAGAGTPVLSVYLVTAVWASGNSGLTTG